MEIHKGYKCKEKNFFPSVQVKSADRRPKVHSTYLLVIPSSSTLHEESYVIF